MADLVTHVCVAWLPGLVGRWRWAGVCALGAALPDLGGRVIPLGLDLVDRLVVGVPEPLIWPWPILHEPLGALLVAALLSQTFRAGDRSAAFGALALGVASHVGLDLLQDHHGVGYLLFAPLSLRRFEIAWIDSEATVNLAWPLLAVTLAVALERFRPWSRRPGTPP